ncbi:MAG: efflux RND transporter periplasmic adaptor subunit [Desulfobacteraceae bacterium]|nr:efflux RND transporter periplasmic adaptor subunit [Desulfobacteraceae bacterium]
MESNPVQKKKIIRSFLRFTWHNLPIILVVLVTALVIFPLTKKISAQKADLARKQTHQMTVAKRLTNVVTMEIHPGLVMEKISLPGVAKPWISLKLASEVKGKIVSKMIDQGTRVKKGDILAIIDKRDYQNSYDSAMASYETALTTKKRFTVLSKKQFVTQSQLDDAEARTRTTKAAMDTAKLNLNRCTIRSPMEGMVDRVYIEIGDFLTIGAPVVTILQIDRLKIEVGIPESDVAAVRKLKTFDMTIDALGGQGYSGKYHYLFSTADSMAHLYNLEIKVNNPDHQILPDMFARVNIVKNKDPHGLAVPTYSLVTLNNKTGVFVEKENQVRFRPVTTGFLDGWKTQIPKGLLPGENVVVVGHKIIEDGETVNVTKTILKMEELIQ